MNNYLIEYTDELEKIIPAVQKRHGRLICSRCGNHKKSQFYQDDYGYYCEQCLMFGKSSTYSFIKRVRKEALPKTEPSLKKKIQLSDLQAIASDYCLEWFEKKQDAIIHAVCGAGKTEIVYQLLIKAVSDQKRVCFATPRKDVVLELLPRFKRDFDQVSIIALYGGSEDRGKDAQLIISTTHQLIHYYHFFDLIIIDEVDAFPYYNNEMLESFVQKAKKATAPLLYLTATPTKKLKKQMKQKILQSYIIPARFHRFSIPLPRVHLVNKLNERLQQKKIPPLLLKWFKEKETQKKQVFVFVPSIKYGHLIHEIFVKHHHLNARFVSSESPNRKSDVEDFRRGKIQFLITTTILERGVTVSNVDVCIILACDDIFDERAIVQIIGRAGRDKLYPTADVRLFCEDYTIGIKDAIKHIQSMNKQNERYKREGV